MSDSTFYKLTNPSFDFEWNGQKYTVKKATLAQVAAFQKKSQELVEAKADSPEQRLVAYCIYLLLKDKIQDLTEDKVFEETSGDVVPLELFVQLGFMNPARFQAALEAAKKQTTPDSGHPSPTEPDGLPSKSAS